MSKKKKFFSSHAKSSAMLVSLAVHAILIIVAFSFVAVTVYKKTDIQFVPKPIKRPKMPPKRLQVPVKTKKKMKPKLRKRLVAKQLNRKVPNIALPEITGVKDGIGSFGSGDGFGSLGI